MTSASKTVSSPEGPSPCRGSENPKLDQLASSKGYKVASVTDKQTEFTAVLVSSSASNWTPETSTVVMKWLANADAQTPWNDPKLVLLPRKSSDVIEDDVIIEASKAKESLPTSFLVTATKGTIFWVAQELSGELVITREVRVLETRNGWVPYMSQPTVWLHTWRHVFRFAEPPKHDTTSFVDSVMKSMATSFSVKQEDMKLASIKLPSPGEFFATATSQKTAKWWQKYGEGFTQWVNKVSDTASTSSEKLPEGMTLMDGEVEFVSAEVSPWISDVTEFLKLPLCPGMYRPDTCVRATYMFVTTDVDTNCVRVTRKVAETLRRSGWVSSSANYSQLRVNTQVFRVSTFIADAM